MGLALGLCVQLVAHAPAVEAAPPAGWLPPLVGVSMGNSVLFWLTIALEAGFGSIGPFNRAFKSASGLTPTDFRRQHIAES